MTRILLIDPGNSRGEINEPIGIAALTAELDAAFGRALVVHQHFTPLDGSVGSLTGFDLVGLSTPLGSLHVIEALYRRWSALSADERPVLVFGGLLATFAPDDLLDRFPGAICVVGEGEEAIVGLVRALKGTARSALMRSSVLDGVPNLVVDRASRRVHTPRRNIEMKWAHAPLRQHAARVGRQGGIVRAEASRGCAWGQCRFCAIQHKYCGEARWRPVPVDRVVDELAELSALGVRNPYYTDEDFVGDDPERAVRLANAIRRARLDGRIAPDMRLYVDMRASSLLATGRRGGPSGEQVLDALIAAGLREVFVGIESGAKDQVRRYQKGATAARNRRVLELLAAKGLSVDVGFIMFDPQMNFAEIGVNLDFLAKTGLWSHDSRMTKELRLEAGTPLLDDYRNEGLVTGGIDLDELCYPYRWQDERAEQVFVTFREWEALALDRVYALQSATRGEVQDVRGREALRALLGQIRAAEHGALRAIFKAVASNQRGTPDLSLWTTRREQVLERWVVGQRTTEVA